jgi:uncharacterized phage protein (TIGR02218 family)
VALCWTLTRRDGAVLGFTEHDADLVVEGVVCRAATGWTAAALEERTGLAVGNTEVAGGLSDAGITEADILAGRFDGARIAAFEVIIERLRPFADAAEAEALGEEALRAAWAEAAAVAV